MSSAEISSGSPEDALPAKRERKLKVATTGIPDNPWLDDVGLLKDRKAHFTVDRLLTCHCDGCTSRAEAIISTSFQKTFHKETPEPTIGVVRDIYERGIQAFRRAKTEMPSVTVFEDKKQ
jgi:hypothetical protein